MNTAKLIKCRSKLVVRKNKAEKEIAKINKALINSDSLSSIERSLLRASANVANWPESKRASFEHTSGLKLTTPRI